MRKQAANNLKVLMPFVDAGAKVVAINPTCAMMMRREYPELLPEALRPQARKLAELVRDPSELLWEIRNEPRFNTDFKSTPGGAVAYHAPCHLRAQGVGFKGRDLLRKIPGVVPKMTMECCGHDGTYAMKVEGFGASIKVGQKAFDGMKDADAEVWATDCPLAALQFQQHAGRKPMHPMSILARAYREDGFAKKVEAPAAARRRGGGEGRRGAMKTVERSEILDYVTYEERRDGDPRRRDEGEGRAPRPRRPLPDVPVREPRDDPLPDPGDGARRAHGARGRHRATRSRPTTSCSAAAGDLGCTLLIEIDDPAARAREARRAGSTLPRQLYAKLEDGTKVRAALRRAAGRRRAALVGAVPEVPGRRPRAGGDRLRPRRPGRRRRDARWRPRSAPRWRRTWRASFAGFRSGFARATLDSGRS